MGLIMLKRHRVYDANTKQAIVTEFTQAEYEQHAIEETAHDLRVEAKLVRDARRSVGEAKLRDGTITFIELVELLQLDLK